MLSSSCFSAGSPSSHLLRETNRSDGLRSSPPPLSPSTLSSRLPGDSAREWHHPCQHTHLFPQKHHLPMPPHTPPPPAPMHFLDLLKGQHPSGATGEPPCCSNIRLRWSHQSHILICDIDILCLLKASSPLCLLWCSADVRGRPQKKKLKLLLNHD